MRIRTAVGPARLAAAIVAAALVPSVAGATDGYFQYGYGARQKALGGAGVADGRDATSASLNPAGLVHAPEESSVSATVFSPLREYTGSGDPGFTPNGTFESNSDYFLIPNLATTYRPHDLGFVDVIGFTVYGNGGMNTDYPAKQGSAGCPPPPFSPGAGPFCFGKTGVNLNQAFVSLAFAKTLFPGVSVGVAPILARQQIELEGLQAFSGNSIDPAHVSNKGTDVSWGGGVRAGIEWEAAPGVRLGVAGNSRVYMHEFERYRGIFAEHGDFDIPASLQAGVAVDVTPSLTLLVDYKHIWYSSIASVSNPSTAPAKLGENNRPGFGWRDIDILKFGAEWRAFPDLTLRAGYSYNENPIPERDVLFNIIAPGVVQHHVTGGFEYRWDKNVSLELAGAYVPEATVAGSEIPPGNPNHDIELAMRQWEVTLGVKYRFDEEAAPLK